MESTSALMNENITEAKLEYKQKSIRNEIGASQRQTEASAFSHRSTVVEATNCSIATGDGFYGG